MQTEAWRTDRPRIGRLVRFSAPEFPATGTARWWGIDGWQIDTWYCNTAPDPRYLSVKNTVKWLPIPRDHEVRLLAQYLINSLGKDILAIPKNLIANFKAIVKELKA